MATNRSQPQQQQQQQRKRQNTNPNPPPIPPKLPENINEVDLAIANELKASWGIAAQDSTPNTTNSSLVSGMSEQNERLAAIGKLKEAGISIEDGWYGPGDLDKAGYGFAQKKRKIRVLSLGMFCLLVSCEVEEWNVLLTRVMNRWWRNQRLLDIGDTRRTDAPSLCRSSQQSPAIA